jgi:hypothetical protein
MSSARKNIIPRFLIVTLYAVIVLSVFRLLIKPAVIPMNLWILYGIYIFCFNLGSEGNLLIDKLLDKRMSWFNYGWKRVYVQLTLTILYTSVMTALPFIIRYMIVERHFPNSKFQAFAIFSFIFAVILLILFDVVFVARNFFINWKASILELENLKQEKLKADYRLLQDQLNPHFLFNSLNVLISEIVYDQKGAVEFTRKLSQVYRYVLQSKNHDLVQVKDELEFAKSFIYLHKVRVGEALKVEIDICEEEINKSIPPMTLQILIENAIKHNKLTEELPLEIKIKSTGEGNLRVINTLRPKTVVDSTKSGLSNIRCRYQLLGKNEVEIETTKQEFIVTVPLLDN